MLIATRGSKGSQHQKKSLATEANYSQVTSRTTTFIDIDRASVEIIYLDIENELIFEVPGKIIS